MSHQVLSFGFMAPLVTPITDAEEREALRDKLYYGGLGISINYEGTLVYSDHGGDEFWGGITFASIEAETQFEEACRSAGIDVTHETRFYCSSWYNGEDSDMDDITLDEFLNKTGQEV